MKFTLDGPKVRELRQEMNISPSMMVGMTDIPTGNLWKLENNRVPNCTLNTLFKLSSVLRVQPSDIVKEY